MSSTATKAASAERQPLTLVEASNAHQRCREIYSDYNILNGVFREKHDVEFAAIGFEDSYRVTKVTLREFQIYTMVAKRLEDSPHAAGYEKKVNAEYEPYDELSASIEKIIDDLRTLHTNLEGPNGHQYPSGSPLFLIGNQAEGAVCPSAVKKRGLKKSVNRKLQTPNELLRDALENSQAKFTLKSKQVPLCTFLSTAAAASKSVAQNLTNLKLIAPKPVVAPNSQIKSVETNVSRSSLSGVSSEPFSEKHGISASKKVNTQSHQTVKKPKPKGKVLKAPLDPHLPSLPSSKSRVTKMPPRRQSKRPNPLLKKNIAKKISNCQIKGYYESDFLDVTSAQTIWESKYAPPPDSASAHQLEDQIKAIAKYAKPDIAEELKNVVNTITAPLVAEIQTLKRQLREMEIRAAVAEDAVERFTRVQIAKRSVDNTAKGVKDGNGTRRKSPKSPPKRAPCVTEKRLRSVSSEDISDVKKRPAKRR